MLLATGGTTSTAPRSTTFANLNQVIRNAYFPRALFSCYIDIHSLVGVYIVLLPIVKAMAVSVLGETSIARIIFSNLHLPCRYHAGSRHPKSPQSINPAYSASPPRISPVTSQTECHHITEYEQTRPSCTRIMQDRAHGVALVGNIRVGNTEEGENASRDGGCRPSWTSPVNSFFLRPWLSTVGFPMSHHRRLFHPQAHKARRLPNVVLTP
jgi:hypothetical protein